MFGKKIDATIHRFTHICKMGIKSYRYFLKMQYDIDNYFQIIRDKEKLRKQAIKNYLLAKLKFILIIVSAVIIFLICNNIVDSHAVKVYSISDIVKAISQMDDAWIGFLGEIVGGMITVCGVWMTIYSNIRQEHQTKLQRSQPIVILDMMYGYEKPDDVMLIGENLRLRSYDNKAENIEIPMSEFGVRNIGFNTAISVSISIEINVFEFNGYKHITLKKDELAIFKCNFIVDKQTFLSILSKQINLFNRSASSMIRKIELNVGEVHGYMNLYYQDVYENENIKIIPIRVQFLRKNDNEYIAELDVEKSQSEILKFIKKKVL